ncbi:MAG: beta-galactosidase [Terrimicrobiaceae bacterium]
MFIPSPRFVSRSGPLSLLVCLVSLSAPARAAEPEVITLDNTAAYSLLLMPGGETKEGYFPMGFVAGPVGTTLPLGFNLREDISSSAGLALNGTFPKFVPQYPDAWNLRYFSMAWPMNDLKDATGWHMKDLPLKSKAHGNLSAVVDHDGKFVMGGDDYDPAVRRFYLDFVRQHVESRLGDPEFAKRIAFWGLDNEAEGVWNYSPFARAKFARWLDAAYGGKIGILNANWRAKFSSFEEAANSQLPDFAAYKTNPALFLDFCTFESTHFVTLLAEMAQMMHQTDPLHRGVVHKSTQQTIEMSGANRKRTFDHAAFADLMRPFSGGIYGIDMYGAGDRDAYEGNYIYNCFRPSDLRPGYGIMLCEANNHGGPDHQFAATMWRLLGNGLKAVDYFTTGWAGAQKDWEFFGFLDSATGRPKGKLFYAARWSQMVHRSEAFWTRCVPAKGLPKVALLMPRRDVLLSDPSNRNEAVSIWSYPENHRWMVFRWLREQGYWVDVIPYTKLNPGYLAQYQALFLVGAEHLTLGEARVIGDYVRAGGAVVADARAGYYDEHHGAGDSLKDLLGMRIAKPSGALRKPEKVDEEYRLIAQQVMADGGESKAVARDPDGKGVAFLHSMGRGKVLYFPLLLGTLAVASEKWDTPSGAGAFLANGPTADGEDYLAYGKEFDIGKWLNIQLGKAGLKPAYAAGAAQGKLRIEQPFADDRGNLAVVITTRAMSTVENLPESPVSLPLPGGPWTSALWAPAEDNSLQPIALKNTTGDVHELTLPGIRTAGVLYLFKKHAPLMGIRKIEAAERSVDGETARVRPGQTFPVSVQLFNTTGAPLAPGVLRCMAPPGWQAQPAEVATGPLAPQESAEFLVQITAQPNGKLLAPGSLAPIVFRLSDGERDISIISATVEGTPGEKEISRLLTDNKSYPATYPCRTETGAEYTYVSGSGDPGKALTNGFGDSSYRFLREWQKEYFATYKEKSISVIFDLKTERKIDTVKMVPGPGKTPPSAWAVAVSSDGVNFRDVLNEALAHRAQEETSPLLGETARYVRIGVEWPQPGGAIAEMEIWGD